MKAAAHALAVLFCVTALGAAQPAAAGATLDAVKRKGHVSCGVSDGLPGFSAPDARGSYRGLDADLCRGVAAAVLGDASKVRFTPLTARERFSALQSGAVDILSRNSTWTSSRDAGMGLHFTAIAYYDGQGFLVSRKLGVRSARELDGATVCLLAGTTTELNLADYFRAQGMRYTAVLHDKSEDNVRALEAGRCDVLTSDHSQLHAQRLRLSNPEAYQVLPELISKEPLGPVVREGDDAWFNVVRWTLFALINAEELGVSSANVGQLARSATHPEVRRLLGLEGDYGKDLGVARDWVVTLVSQVGNYGEIFERNLGMDSALKIPRGLNALWSRGGLQYAPPVR